MTRPIKSRGRLGHDLDWAVELIDRARPKLVEAMVRMDRARHGIPPTGGEGRSSGPADPTATQAFTADIGSDALAALTAAVDRITSGATALADEVEAWSPRHPSKTEQRDTERSDDLGCTPCRAHGHYALMAMHSDCKGNLPHPTALCTWHYRWVLKFGKLPGAVEVVNHYERGKNRVAAG